MATSFEVEPAPAAPRRSVFQSSDRMRSLHRATVTAALASRDDTFAEALKLEAEEFGEEAISKITSFEAIANFVIGCIGAGIVVFPKVMALNGWLQAIVLIILARFVCMETGLLLLESCELAEQCASARKGSMANYEEIAGAAFGRTGTVVLAVVKNIYAMGALFAYSVLLTEGLSDWLALTKVQARWFLVLPILITLSMITNLKQLARVAPVGTLAVFTQCAAICVMSLLAWVWKGLLTPGTTVNLNLLQVGSALAVFVFGFDGVVNLPSIRGQMSNPDELPEALRKGILIVSSFCIVVMCCGFFGYGQALKYVDAMNDNVISGMSESCSGFSCLFAGVASLGVIVNLLISYPLIFFTVISFVQSAASGSLAEPLSKVNIAVRVGMALLFMVPVESPMEIISVASAVFGSCLSIFFPLAMFYKLRQKAQELGQSVVVVSDKRKITHGVVVLTGAVSMIFGLADALKSFM